MKAVQQETIQDCYVRRRLHQHQQLTRVQIIVSLVVGTWANATIILARCQLPHGTQGAPSTFVAMISLVLQVGWYYSGQKKLQGNIALTILSPSMWQANKSAKTNALILALASHIHTKGDTHMIVMSVLLIAWQLQTEALGSTVTPRQRMRRQHQHT